MNLPPSSFADDDLGLWSGLLRDERRPGHTRGFLECSLVHHFGSLLNA